jgi:hypothetical protein
MNWESVRSIHEKDRAKKSRATVPLNEKMEKIIENLTHWSNYHIQAAEDGRNICVIIAWMTNLEFNCMADLMPRGRNVIWVLTSWCLNVRVRWWQCLKGGRGDGLMIKAPFWPLLLLISSGGLLDEL